MSVVGIWVTVGTIVLLVGFAVAIERGNAVGLIAGYQQGDLPPQTEAELVRDVRNLLLVVSLSFVPSSSTSQSVNSQPSSTPVSIRSCCSCWLAGCSGSGVSGRAHEQAVDAEVRLQEWSSLDRGVN